jgi:hypothetical protein
LRTDAGNVGSGGRVGGTVRGGSTGKVTGGLGTGGGALKMRGIKLPCQEGMGNGTAMRRGEVADGDVARTDIEGGDPEPRPMGGGPRGPMELAVFWGKPEAGVYGDGKRRLECGYHRGTG